jgi:hypothetical protein
MRILGAIVRPPIRLMAAFNAELSDSAGVRRQFVGRQPIGNEAVFLQKLAHEFQRCRLVSL